MLYVISQMFNIFQSYSTTTLSHKTQSLRHVTASSNIPSCSCLPFFSSPRTANPFPFHHNYTQNIFKSSFFQLRRICLLYSIAFQHFLVKVILINNLVDQTTDKFTNLISIFKTHRKSSVMYLNINRAWVNRPSSVTKPRSCICKSFLLSIILFYKISCNCFYSNCDKIA